MFSKISPKKISDEIIEQFMSLLGKGELKPGDALPSERELANLIGVSRPPLREALNALQALGFVEIRPRRKIIVKSIAEKTFLDPLSLFISEDIDKAQEAYDNAKADTQAATDTVTQVAPAVARAMAMVVDMVTEDKVGGHTGLYYFFSMMASIVAPPLVGGVIDVLSYPSMIKFSVLAFIAALLCILFVKKGEAQDAPSLKSGT